jgi:hypothetical protein
MNICDVAAVTQHNTTPLLICFSLGACWLVGWLVVTWHLWKRIYHKKLLGFSVDHREKLEFPLCKQEMVCLINDEKIQ